jgi:STE24 endopeptidase
VPDGLDLPAIRLGDYFAAADLRRADRFERFFLIEFPFSVAALLIAMWVFAKKGTGYVRESAAGPIGTGMLLGMLTFGIVWFVQLPFGLVELWWGRRHGVTKVDYWELALGSFFGLAGEFAFICLTILVVMGLARLLGRRWWMVAGPALVLIICLFAFVQPWLLAPDTRKLRDPVLRAEARRLEREEGLGHVKLRVEEVHEQTSAANAFAAGFGPSRIVVLWDTILDGRFKTGEVSFVLAHEFGHHARRHILKALAWYGLFALPVWGIVYLATRRRGGLTRPEAIPLALFTLTVLQFVSLPIDNVISRRMEAEADWAALTATRDPACGTDLFRHFTTTSLSDPRPPTWAYVLLETHPTIEQRIAMMEAWKKREPALRRTCPAAVPREGS